MSLGKVTVNQVNNLSGETSEVERVFLWIGEAAIATNNGQLLAIGAATDLDELLGEEDSELKTNLTAAIANCNDTNFVAYVIPIDPDTDDWKEIVFDMLDAGVDLPVEGIVLTTPVASAIEIEALQTDIELLIVGFAKYWCVHAPVAGIDAATQTWATYQTATAALVADIACDRVAIVPQLHGNNLGVVIGRLCDPGVTLADTPMRVATGALVGLGVAPVDSAGSALTLAHLTYLAAQRLSVPQWYVGYDGTYWGDHPLLDVEGGDFQVFEHRRVLDYLSRRVRLLAIGRIADRQLNSTAASIAKHQIYFCGPLRDAAKSIVIGTREIPGLVKSPVSTAVAIVWTDSTSVAIAITATPYYCPKSITVYLGLDLS